MELQEFKSDRWNWLKVENEKGDIKVGTVISYDVKKWMLARQDDG
jgi:hypothetical protein